MQRSLGGEFPNLERALLEPEDADHPFLHPRISIHRDTIVVPMRDGTKLATETYHPPGGRLPTVLIRTPYGRGELSAACMSLARRGYAVLIQDVRGTGDSEPDDWEYFLHEPNDSYDFVEWVTHQPWWDGHIFGCGSSYRASTQWCMAAHPKMTSVVPEFGGLGVVFRSAKLHMFLNAYSKTVGKGAGKVSVPFTEMERLMLQETLEGGWCDPSKAAAPTAELCRLAPVLEGTRGVPFRVLFWQLFAAADVTERAALLRAAQGADEITYVSMESLLSGIGNKIAFGAHSIPAVSVRGLVRSIQAPALIVTGWYDWNLNGALATWSALTAHGHEQVVSRSALIITPSAHNTEGYREGAVLSPELARNFCTGNIVELLALWFDRFRSAQQTDWPRVAYYLLGANEWRSADAWPPPESDELRLYLVKDGLAPAPSEAADGADQFTFDPDDPTPTVGGSIVSAVYPPGSVDISGVLERPDVLTFATPPLENDLDIVGPVRAVLHVSSDARDTDFSVRISDVFPDGRSIQLQTGFLRMRHRAAGPEILWMEPGDIYEIEIDMWAIANRFKSGHRLQIDVSSADFPRYDRNPNTGPDGGPARKALQSIYRNVEHQSHVVLRVLR